MTGHALIVSLVAVALTEVAAIATSIYLHRTLAHRALHVHPALAVLFRAVLWMTTGQNRREWVAVHRKHHTFTQRAGVIRVLAAARLVVVLRATAKLP